MGNTATVVSAAANPPTTGSLLQELTNAELQVLKPVLLNFATALQQPGANILSLQNAGAALMLQAAALSNPAQAAAFNLVGAALIAKLNQLIPTPPVASAPVAA